MSVSNTTNKLTQSELCRIYAYANFFSMDAYNNYISARLLFLHGHKNHHPLYGMLHTGSVLVALASEQLIKSIFYLKDPSTKIRKHLLLSEYVRLNKEFGISQSCIKLGVKMHVIWETKYSQDYNPNEDKKLKKEIKSLGIDVSNDSYLQDYYGIAGCISIAEFDSFMYELFSLFKKTLIDIGYDNSSIKKTSIFTITEDKEELQGILLESNCKSVEFKNLLGS